MPVEDAVMGILTQYWDDIWSPLDADRRDELAGLLRELTPRISDDGVGELVKQITQIMRSALPSGHAALLELEQAIMQVGGAQPDWGQLPMVLRTLSAQIVRQQARDQLLGASALSAEQVRAFGEDPDQQFLIRLEAPGGEQRIPAFQFDRDGRVIDVVLDVNERLGSDADPWGVADWWLGTNAWLPAPPADLIGRDDHLVRNAAAAIAAEDW